MPLLFFPPSLSLSLHLYGSLRLPKKLRQDLARKMKKKERKGNPQSKAKVKKRYMGGGLVEWLAGWLAFAAAAVFSPPACPTYDSQISRDGGGGEKRRFAF